jgi:hypothetical protein
MFAMLKLSMTEYGFPRPMDSRVGPAACLFGSPDIRALRFVSLEVRERPRALVNSVLNLRVS